MLDVIAFDANDTLWHNETLYSLTQAKFAQLLTPYRAHADIDQALLRTETRNLQYFGYGIKGFTLSMIETAIELTDGSIQGRDIQQIIEFARAMSTAPVELLEHVEETVKELSNSHRLMIITKGDLFDQESKVAESGLADYFSQVEVLNDKTTQSYQACLDKHRIAPQNFLMVGNSLKSDVQPVLALGGLAVYIPYKTTWAHELLDNAHELTGYVQLEHIGLVPDYVRSL